MLGFIQIFAEAVGRLFTSKEFTFSVNVSLAPLTSHNIKIPLGSKYKVGTLKAYIANTALISEERRKPFECDFSRTKGEGKSLAWLRVTTVISTYFVYSWRPEGFRFDLDGVLSGAFYGEIGSVIEWDFVYLNATNELEIQWSNTHPSVTQKLELHGGGFAFK